jgi:hypothetical protein
MVDWYIMSDKSEIKISSGKIILASPCNIEYQKELILELQMKNPRFKILDSERNHFSQETPIIIPKHIIHLSGKDLKRQFVWWCEQFKVNAFDDEVLKGLVPSENAQWSSMKIEKKIALFSGVSIIASRFSYIFMGEIHLESNAQEFLFNFLKYMTHKTNHQLFVLWSYRVLVPHTVPFYFKGFMNNVV